MQIRESYINETRGYRFGDSEWYEPWTDDRGQLFRECQREYGRCVSRIYRDTPTGTITCGWVFQKRMEYEDARPHQRPEDRTYIREVWVEVREDPDDQPV